MTDEQKNAICVIAKLYKNEHITEEEFLLLIEPFMIVKSDVQYIPVTPSYPSSLSPTFTNESKFKIVGDLSDVK